MVVTPTPTDLLPDNFISISEQLERNVANFPTSNALVSMEDGDSITWQELWDWSARIALYLRNLGIQKNDRILVLGENTTEHLILYYAIQSFGSTYCTINTDVNYNHLIEMVDRISPKLIFIEQGIGNLIIEPKRKRKFIFFDDRRSDNDLFTKLSKLNSKNLYHLKNAQDDHCVICFTSGTSAQPKGVIHSFSNYQAIAQHQLERWSLDNNDRILEFRSISWASAHMISLNPTILAGATLLFAKNFSYSRFVNWIEKYSPTIIVAVPAVVNMLLEQPIKDGKEVFKSVRFISCSTAPLMADAHRRFEEIYGVELVQLYGMSEGGIVAANTPGNRKIGSVGAAGMYQNISIRDEDNNLLEPGKVGEIESVSAQHAYAYLYAGGKTEPLRGKPLRTGDLGYFDDEGFIRITGRAKDVVIRGGVNISPLEIDSLISQRPGVLEVVTFGIPDPVYGEDLVSWVVISPDSKLTAKALARFCDKNLPEKKCPKSIELVKEIPKNARGKIDRKAARRSWDNIHQ